MGDRTAIEWAANADGTPGATWNPIVGCSHASPGCRNCYAQGEAARQQRIAAAAGRTTPYDGTTQPSKTGPVFTGKVALASDAIWQAPNRRRRPTTWFVNSMGDIAADGVEDAWLDDLWSIMGTNRRHTFIILTKRPARLRAYLEARPHRLAALPKASPLDAFRPPLPNVWLGVTAEDQERADQRIPELLATPAAVRFVSYEPAIGPLDLTHIESGCGDGVYDALRPYSDEQARADWGDVEASGYPALDWVICGGESGRGEHIRPMHPDWARQVRDDCAAAGVPFFFKQWGEWAPTGVFDCDPAAHAQYESELVTMTGHKSGPAVLAFPTDYRPQSDLLRRVGKRRAGRLLDGRTHDDRPPLAGVAA